MSLSTVKEANMCSSSEAVAPSIIRGRAFVFGDGIDTDVLAPGAYMKRPIEELAQHCLEAIDPSFASSIQKGDMVFAGRGFGMGSSREQAVQALKVLGCGAVFAEGFARIFFRNAINLGLPAISIASRNFANTGDQIEFDLSSARLRNLTQQTELQADALPPFLLEILSDGGLMENLAKRFSHTA
jgi:3-isopropylmalate/(R)-2-methylmalate dehydratase small subunit